MGGVLYQLSEVGFAYPGRPAALTDVSAEFGRGGHVVLLGANGAGKSTLLMLLAGLQFPTSGQIRFDGEVLSHESLAGDAQFRRRFRSRVGVLFQNSEVQLFCPSVREEVAFGPLQIFGRGEALERAQSTLEAFRLADLADEPPFALSGGEKRRVALAAVLASGPEVLLLDEPTANLDPRSCDELLATLESYKSDPSRTLIVATHHLEIAADLADTGVVLTPDGRLTRQGPIGEILHDEELLIEANLLSRRRSRRQVGNPVDLLD